MMEVMRDKDSNITAFCEYLIFTKDGQLSEEGNTMFVGEMEINPSYRGNGIVKKFIKTLLVKYPKIEQGFFYRRSKYPGRDFRLYKRERFEKLTGG